MSIQIGEYTPTPYKVDSILLIGEIHVAQALSKFSHCFSDIEMCYVSRK